MAIEDVHFYKFDIGRYRRSTTHLTLIEHGIYRTLLDSYYLSEKPLTADLTQLMRQHSVRCTAEKDAFDNVLKDFFTLSDDGYCHDSCDHLIKLYKTTSKAKSTNSQRRWSKDSHHGKNKMELDFSSWPSKPNDQLWSDWSDMRVRKKQVLSQTTVTRVGNQLQKAVQLGFSVDECFGMWIERGWRGFKADWMDNQQSFGKENKTNKSSSDRVEDACRAPSDHRKATEGESIWEN